MSTAAASTSSAASEPPKKQGFKNVDFKNYIPVSVEAENATSEEDTKKIWQAIYRSVDANVNNEDAQRDIRCAVYAYGLLNGTSPAGNYKGKIKSARGVTVLASAIANAAGLAIRRFYRANMEESYYFLKGSGVAEHYPTIIAKARELGIGPSEAFVLADWLVRCPFFTPVEERAYAAATKHALLRARGARGGKTLEEVSGENREDMLDAQASRPNIIRSAPISDW